MDDTTDDTVDDVDEVATPAELPEFEGLQPVGVVTKITGGGSRITRPMHLGERGVLVVEYEVTDVGHSRTDDGVKRKHTLKAVDLLEVPDRPGKRLLNNLKESYRMATETGGLPFADQGDAALAAGDDIAVDPSGVAMTPADLDELGLADSSRDPVVVVTLDGARAMWPDDWGNNPPPSRPAPGDTLWMPGGSPGADEELVVEALDPVSGDVLGSWTEEDQAARLLEEEQAAEAREAAAELAEEGP